MIIYLDRNETPDVEHIPPGVLRYLIEKAEAEAPQASGPALPRLRIFDTCANLIRTLPAVQFDEKRPEDVATEPHELTHAPDALRGFCVYRSSPADPPPTEKMCGVEVFYDRSLQSSADEILGLGEDIYVV